MKIISIIPARGGSKGIPNKNLISVLNRPLVTFSIQQSLLSQKVTETYVSTEDTQIKEISKKYGSKIIDRPMAFATDDASTESVLLHAAEYLDNDFDYMVLLQPTSPLRYPTQIDEAIELLISKNGDSLLSVYRNDVFFWDKNCRPLNYDFKNRPRRQEKDWEYVENGSIYITKKDILLKKKNRLGGNIIMYEMPKWMSYEIDDPFDLDLIRFIGQEKFKIYSKGWENIFSQLKLIIFDVDGVFTDGSVLLDSNGKEYLQFSRIDGKGIELLRKTGIKTSVITSEDSEIVRKRMKKLKINDIFINIKDKIKVYNRLKDKYKLKDNNIAFLGDDVQDLSILKRVGFPCCPKNAQNEVKKECLYISEKKGGNGFVRDICNLITENYKERIRNAKDKNKR